MFCHFGPFFGLSPPDNPKNQNFEKLKETPGDIIILHKCHCTKNEVFFNGKLYFLCSVYQKGKNDSDMVYGSPEIWSAAERIFLILDHLLLF